MITYIDTYNNNGLTYSDYLTFCEDNEIAPAEEDSNAYLTWLSEEMETEIDDFFCNLRYSDFSGPVSVCGSLGLWYGRGEIEPKKFDSLEDAITACADGAYDLKITLDKGILSVTASHHDGTNKFSIHRPNGHFWPKYLF